VASPRRQAGPQGVLRLMGADNAGTLWSSGSGVVGGSVLLGGVASSSDQKLLTVLELALKLIPANNGLKAQLVAVMKSVGSVSVLETVVAELRTSQAELNRKVGELVAKLADARANVKTLEDWMVAMEFTQIPGGGGVPAVPMHTARVVAPVNVGGASSSGMDPHAIISASGTVIMPELSSSDIDRLLGLDGGSSLIY